MPLIDSIDYFDNPLVLVKTFSHEGINLQYDMKGS